MIFHIYYSGHGLTIQHYRYNSDCDVYEELEPIDRNLNYDFDYQQINHLPREVTILPVSVLIDTLSTSNTVTYYNQSQ